MRLVRVRGGLVPALLIAVTAWAGDLPEKWSLRDCLDYADKNNPQIKEAREGVGFARGRAKEALGARWPRLDLATYLAPVPAISGDVTADRIDWSRWGPYAFGLVEGGLPLYTFGRIPAYLAAAQSGVEVAEGEVKQKREEIGLEVKRMYYSALLAQTLLDLIEGVHKDVAEAESKASEEYQKGTGKVTRADLGKIQVALAEVEKYHHAAVRGTALAGAALRFYLGLPKGTTVPLAADRIEPESVDLKPLPDYQALALQNRGEWRQMQSGLRARQKLVEAKRSEFLPVMVLGGRMAYGYSPLVQDQPSIFSYDPFNFRLGGVGLGLKWDFQPGSTRGKVAQEEAERRKLVEKEPFAREGIQMQVAKAYEEAKEARDNADSYRRGMKAAKAWLGSTVLGHSVGTAQAADALEAYAAYAKTRKDYYEAVFQYNLALAELSKAVGAEVLSPNP